MENFTLIKKKLIENGFTVYLSRIDDIDYLRGGHESSLDFEIWIKINNGKFIFIDIFNQKSEEKEFNSEDEMLEYILKKYNL